MGVSFTSVSPSCAMSDIKKSHTVLIILAALCISLLVFVGLQKFRSPSASQKTAAIETEAQAVESIRALPEVVDYEQRLAVAGTTAYIDAQSEDAQWVVQVYEIKDDHTATFNWYTVDKATGKITAEFP